MAATDKKTKRGRLINNTEKHKIRDKQTTQHNEVEKKQKEKTNEKRDNTTTQKYKHERQTRKLQHN